MTTIHHFHVRSAHDGVIRRPVPFIATGIAAAACAVVVALISVGGTGAIAIIEPAVDDAFAGNEQVAASLEGRAFAEAVQSSVSGIPSPSILLDGAAFALAVDEAVAFASNGSALLHGTAFADALAKKVAAAAD